jgi:type VI secretion system protein ImpG
VFNKYFQSELSYLRELGREYGQANPSLAGLLAERGADPDVERLLEGFCFLTARIRERLDGAVPEVVHGLVDLLIPQYLRPIPAASIVEFTPHAKVLRGRTRIPRGAEVAATPLDGTACRFRTTSEVDLVPATLTDVVLDQASALAPVIRVGLSTSEQGKAELFHADGLRLFLHGDLPVTSTLLLWLLRYCRSVSLREAGGGRSVQLGTQAIVAPMFAPEHALLPWPRRANDGYRLLVEYFTLPQKLLFVDVRGLDRAASLAGERFELCFEFERPPALPARLTKDAFKLHCAPVVNLFAGSGEPLSLSLPGTEGMLRPAAYYPTNLLY